VQRLRINLALPLRILAISARGKEKKIASRGGRRGRRGRSFFPWRAGGRAGACPLFRSSAELGDLCERKRKMIASRGGREGRGGGMVCEKMMNASGADYSLPQGGLNWRTSANVVGVAKNTEVDPIEVSASRDMFTR
jgi:hypothetical protein